MAGFRGIFAAIGATGAAAAAVVTGYSLKHSEADEIAGLTFNDLESEICLRNDVAFFDGAKKGCVTKSDLKAWFSAPVLDDNGAPVTVKLSHPTDINRDLSVVKTCAEYVSLKKQNWYSGTTRAMRREAFFERACGMLTYLAGAEAPVISHFENGLASRSDVASLSAGPPFKFVGNVEADALEPLSQHQINIQALSDGVWRVSAGGQSARVQEIAHADFNGDGVGDILSFISIGVDEATATVGVVGLMEKPSMADPVRFQK